MQLSNPAPGQQAGQARISANPKPVLEARGLPVGPNQGLQNGPGFILTDLSFGPVYTNNAALDILDYPKQSATTFDARRVRERIRSILQTETFTAVSTPAGFVSGRRRYICRPFLLESRERETRQPIVALLMERRPRDPVELSEVSHRFHLSPRESETVGHLIHGLTTKEVAERMSISPNTVKQFVRLVMSKMGVTTRSGIVGKVLTS